MKLFSRTFTTADSKGCQRKMVTEATYICMGYKSNSLEELKQRIGNL